MHADELCHAWLSDVLPEMHKKRRSALCAVVGGALRGGTLNVTTIGRSIQSRAKAKHSIKRADRLLSNRHLQSEYIGIYARLTRRALGAAEQPVIIVDWSDIDARREFFLLRAAVAVKGRSLPLYEEVHTRATREKRRTHRAFLERLGQILPSGCVPTIVTDAGFRTPWFKQVRRLGWNFVGRVRNREKVQITDESGWIGAKSLYAVATPKPQHFERALLARSNPLRCSLVMYKSKPKGRKRFTKMGHRARSRTSLVNAARAREPWLLVTSLPGRAANAIVEIYAARMQIEESFRDLKCLRYGLGLYHNRTYKLRRMKVMLLIGALATTFTWLLGGAARTLQLDHQFQANTTRSTPVLSNVFIGTQIVRSSKLAMSWQRFKNALRFTMPLQHHL